MEPSAQLLWGDNFLSLGQGGLGGKAEGSWKWEELKGMEEIDCRANRAHMGGSSRVGMIVRACIIEEGGVSGQWDGLKEGRETGCISLTRCWGKPGMEQVKAGKERDEVGVQEVVHVGVL